MSKSLREIADDSTFFFVLYSYNRFCLNAKSFHSEREGEWSVYYELYVDVLFLVNFIMDYILLLIVRKMLKCSATHGRICLGALVGSLLTCLIVILPIPYAFIKFVLFHVAVNTCMIQVGLKINHIRSFVKALILLYIGGFLLGGVLEFFHQYVRIGSLFLATAIGGYYLVLGIWKFISYMQRQVQYSCNVELYLGGQRYLVKAFVDTGNQLRDPVSGKPVSILNQKTAKTLFQHESAKYVRYIPYQTVGKKEGVLPAFSVDKMCICGETPCWVDFPLIGVSEEEHFVGGEYEMILNPNLF